MRASTNVTFTDQIQDGGCVHVIHRHRTPYRSSCDCPVPPRCLEARNLPHHELLSDRVLGWCLDNGLGSHWKGSERNWHWVQRFHLVSLQASDAEQTSDV
jgi:hypothetical protein